MKLTRNGYLTRNLFYSYVNGEWVDITSPHEVHALGPYLFLVDFSKEDDGVVQFQPLSKYDVRDIKERLIFATSDSKYEVIAQPTTTQIYSWQRSDPYAFVLRHKETGAISDNNYNGLGSDYIHTATKTQVAGGKILSTCSLPLSDGKVFPLQFEMGDWNWYGIRNCSRMWPLDGYRQQLMEYIPTVLGSVPQEGIKKIEASEPIANHLRKLASEEPLLWNWYQFLHSKKQSAGSTNNQLLATFLGQVGSDYNLLKDSLEESINLTWCSPGRAYDLDDSKRESVAELPGVKDKLDATKAKTQWQYAKSAAGKADVLGISEAEYPNLRRLLTDGDITFNVFHEPGNEDKLVNVEFSLFEWALSQPNWLEPMKEIMGTISGRTTYTHSISSYVAFLKKLPRYLDKHAPRADGSRWKAQPRFVNTQWELEMDEATEEGTTKKRSAFTPVADNETGIVTIPYASIRMYGRQTTYCYSEDYYVAEEDMRDPLGNGIFLSDLAEKLNGRDDYGLMFYTLTGTPRNTGYPTFLIIFERTKGTTVVHFHRVHPSRFRGPNGSDTPSHLMIEECYRYMAGNVRAEEIAHQQGDIILIRVEGPAKTIDEGAVVKGFENHSFVSRGENPVMLYRSTAKSKSNILGWLHAVEGMGMPHPEHESIVGISPGWYEVRRAKSWEANPSAVWTLNID